MMVVARGSIGSVRFQWWLVSVVSGRVLPDGLVVVARVSVVSLRVLSDVVVMVVARRSIGSVRFQWWLSCRSFPCDSCLTHDGAIGSVCFQW